jgi:hypothetical protein
MFNDMLALGSGGESGSVELVDKNHYIQKTKVEPQPFVNGASYIFEANVTDTMIFNTKDYVSMGVTFNNSQNLSFYFIKSDGTQTSTSGTSFTPNPYNITDYDYVWIVATAGARTLTITFS